MFFNKLHLVLVATLIIATSISAQPADSSVGKNWVKTVSINTQFPDPDKVQPGDSVWVEIAGKRKCFIANPDSLDSQWAVTVAALREASSNKDVPVSVTVVEGEKNKWLLSVLILLLAGSVLCLFLAKRKVKPISESAISSVIEPPPILKEVPDFGLAAQEEICQSAELAVANTYRGRGFEIIGKVEQGVIDGRMKIFALDGSSRIEGFQNEPGYRTTIRFIDTNKVKTVVWRAACFNPLWSASDADFFGTFTPLEEGATPEVIGDISEAESEELKNSITSGVELVLPRKEATAPSAIPLPAKKEICLSELTLVNDKVIVKGDIPLNNDSVELLIKLVKGVGKSQ